MLESIEGGKLTDGIVINDLLGLDFGGRHGGWIAGGQMKEAAKERNDGRLEKLAV